MHTHTHICTRITILNTRVCIYTYICICTQYFTARGNHKTPAGPVCASLSVADERACTTTVRQEASLPRRRSPFVRTNNPLSAIVPGGARMRARAVARDGRPERV